jgi:hypothetical protein
MVPLQFTPLTTLFCTELRKASQQMHALLLRWNPSCCLILSTPCIPSNPTVHFDHLSSSVLPQDNQATSPHPGGGSSSTVPQYFLYDDPESQSIGNPI